MLKKKSKKKSDLFSAKKPRRKILLRAKKTEVDKGEKKSLLPAEQERKEISALEWLAEFSEKTRLDEYVALMNRPVKLLWLNFSAGLAKGVGFFLGASAVGALVFLMMYNVLGWLVDNAGGMPWIGEQAKELVLWIKDIIDQHKPGS